MNKSRTISSIRVQCFFIRNVYISLSFLISPHLLHLLTHLTSPHLTLPYLTSPHLTSPLLLYQHSRQSPHSPDSFHLPSFTSLAYSPYTSPRTPHSPHQSSPPSRHSRYLPHSVTDSPLPTHFTHITSTHIYSPHLANLI